MVHLLDAKKSPQSPIIQGFSSARAQVIMLGIMYVMYMIALVSALYRLRLAPTTRIPEHETTERRLSSLSSRKGIGVVKIAKCSGDRRVDFSFPLSRYFDRGVLLDKMILTSNTVI